MKRTRCTLLEIIINYSVEKFERGVLGEYLESQGFLVVSYKNWLTYLVQKTDVLVEYQAVKVGKKYRIYKKTIAFIGTEEK